MGNNLNVILTTDIKPEDCLIEKPKTFGRYNVSIDKILELKAKDPKMGYRKIGNELGVNYKVIQRAYKSYLKEQNPQEKPEKKPEQNSEFEVISNKFYKDHTLGREFNIGQLIVSGYANTNLNFRA
jgi:hypothetical protein